MRYIKKGREPHAWTEHCTTPGVTYEAIPELRLALAKEQGYICAFCMRRVHVGNDGKQVVGKPVTRIAHLHAQANDDSKQLEYRNLVLACAGKDTQTEETCCDLHQESENVTIPLFNAEQMLQVRISGDGRLLFNEKKHQHEIDSVLNLNCNKLLRNRKNVIDGTIATLGKTKWTSQQLRQKIDKLSSIDGEGKLKEYCEVPITYLRKKLKQLS